MNLVSSFFVPALFFGQAGVPNAAHIDPGDLVAIIIIPSLCLLIGWLVWVLTRTRHLRVKAQIDMHNRLAARIQSMEDIIQLTQTEEGRHLLDAISVARPTSREEILRSVQTGVVFTVVGFGSLCVRFIFPMGYGVLILAGILFGVVGIGIIVSSAVVYRLSRYWKLISQPESNTHDDVMPDKRLFRQ